MDDRPSVSGRALYALGFFARLIRGSAYFLFHRQVSYKVLVLQILFTFVEALGIASLLALGIGATVISLGTRFLEGFSQGELIYPLLITIVTRELGPLLVAFLVIARSATAMATELAGMVVSHEVEAYVSVGLDPIEDIGVPRFLGIIVSMFLLNIYFSLFGLAGSFVVSQLFNPMPASVYFNKLLQIFTIYDILISVIKSIVFGMIIAVVAIYEGFAVERSSTEIPVAGLKAVGASFGWCILANIALSILYYTML
ncbi:MAG: ABC transporter permease [Spirochaetaceae bacterium]|jgi:phospholipid/cholesterol/gamma-HCH transport system permease protein|nr:ABC transporter permease [Spirochaetaceae bacterium]